MVSFAFRRVAFAIRRITSVFHWTKPLWLSTVSLPFRGSFSLHSVRVFLVG